MSSWGDEMGMDSLAFNDVDTLSENLLNETIYSLFINDRCQTIIDWKILLGVNLHTSFADSS